MDAIEYFKGMRKILCEEYLKGIPKDSVGYQTTLREMSFYDAAIKALEQNHCTDAISRSEAIRIASGYCHWTNIPDELAKLPSVTPKHCEDAISRQDVLELLNEYDPRLLMRSDYRKMVEDLPSVSTEKTGRWEEVQFRTIPYNRISKAKKCSVCGKRKDKYVTWNYCPNCGCRMMGVKG